MPVLNGGLSDRCCLRSRMEVDVVEEIGDAARPRLAGVFPLHLPSSLISHGKPRLKSTSPQTSPQSPLRFLRRTTHFWRITTLPNANGSGPTRSRVVADGLLGFKAAGSPLRRGSAQAGENRAWPAGRCSRCALTKSALRFWPLPLPLVCTIQFRCFLRLGEPALNIKQESFALKKMLRKRAVL